MLKKQIPLFVFFVIFNTPYDECFDAARKHLERLHKKNGEKSAILANFGLKIGEMGALHVVQLVSVTMVRIFTKVLRL